MSIKKKIVNILVGEIQNELTKAKEASEGAGSYKKDGDMKQEGKYDTRAIEAGQLAGALEARVIELEQELELLADIPLKELTEEDSASLGAIVTLETNGVSQNYFLSSTSGGKMLTVDGNPYMVISVFSPIGREALELSVGDEFEIETPKGERTYKLIHVQ